MKPLLAIFVAVAALGATAHAQEAAQALSGLSLNKRISIANPGCKPIDSDVRLYSANGLIDAESQETLRSMWRGYWSVKQ